MKSQIEALEEGTYDDTEIRGLIAANDGLIKENAAKIAENTQAINTLNADAETVGSVANVANAAAAAEVAKIVAGADASFDTLKEIADWIANDTTGSAEMANDIDALEAKLVGIDTTVAAKIASSVEKSLKTEGVDKYALAADLTALANRVEALENAGYQNAEAVAKAIDDKIAALDLANTYEAKGAAATAETNAKAYADGLASNYDKAGSAAQALTDAKAYSDANLATAKTYSDTNLATAKSYTDTEMAKIQPLTEAEIDQAIANAKNNA